MVNKEALKKWNIKLPKRNPTLKSKIIDPKVLKANLIKKSKIRNK